MRGIKIVEKHKRGNTRYVGKREKQSVRLRFMQSVLLEFKGAELRRFFVVSH